ncbi:hypothetical protein [Polymorphospora sp. NPDC050346]|uniref:hypothetical protein n=1 Tax=Polymorphospora sp. NPDC050346 TaxID=3155780 RepID=UPI0034087BAF
MRHQAAIEAFAALIRGDHPAADQILNTIDRDDLWHLKQLADQFAAYAENHFRTRPE